MVNSKRRRRTPSYEQPEREGPIRSNFFRIFLQNFGFIPFFLPSMVFACLFVAAGGWVAFVLSLLLLIPAGPAVAAMYDVGFTLVNDDPLRSRRGFWDSYRRNFCQGAATMAAMLPFLTVLLLTILLKNRPRWMLITLAAGSYVLTAFSILAFAQIALVDLKLRQIWKNALYLIPLTGTRGILVTLAHLAFFAALYKWLSVTFLAFLILGPALLVVWTCRTIFPRLRELLVRGDGEGIE